MNVDRIREVGRLILAEPRRFDMSDWIFANDNAPCGTACCFAGEWAVLEFGIDVVKRGLYPLTGPLIDRYKVGVLSDACRDSLGLPNDWLFFVPYWPIYHIQAIDKTTPGTEEYASYFVNVVLEDYIATNGWAEGPYAVTAREFLNPHLGHSATVEWDNSGYVTISQQIVRFYDQDVALMSALPGTLSGDGFDPVGMRQASRLEGPLIPLDRVCAIYCCGKHWSANT